MSNVSSGRSLTAGRHRRRADSAVPLAVRQAQTAKKGKVKIKAKEGKPTEMKVKTKSPDRKYTKRIGSIGPGPRGSATFNT